MESLKEEKGCRSKSVDAQVSVMDRSRLLVSVFVIVSYAAAPCYSWDPNHVYLYDYAASVTTGSTGANAVLVQGQLSVDVVHAGRLTFRLNGANVTGSKDVNWSSSQELETGFDVDLQNNTVQSLVYPSRSNVSQWVVSVHKGIASLFSLRYPEPTEGLGSSTTYTSMEEEVTGTCANVYDWIPLHGDNKLNAMCHPTLGNRYQLFKTRDFDNCTHLPMYNLVAPAGWRCKPSSAICENVQSRSLVERVELCGDLSGRNLDILEMELREDWISQPWGAKDHQPTPHRMSITQRVILTGKDSKSQVLLDVASRRRIREEEEVGRYDRQSLGYTFGQMETNLVLDDQTMEQFLEQIKQLRSILFRPAELVKRSDSKLRRRIFHQFRSLSPLQLASLTERARHQLTPHIWSFYVQQMATVGSSATLDLVKQLMERQQITNQDIMGLISGFSMFLRQPSDHVLSQLLSLLDLKVVRSEPDLRQTAMVSLASFFRMACIDRLSAESRFPSQYLNFSSGSRREVWPERLVARLAVEIRDGESGDRSAALSALNILGHPSLIPVVLPLIEGENDSNPAVRTKAVLALHKLAHHGDPSAIRILHTVYANPSDNYQVRLAAFTLLMLSCPPDHVWQSVAARTWFEPRSHVASFVFTTFDTLATFRSPLRFLQKLSLKAKKVLKLTKPVIRGRSANYIWSYEKRRRLLASYLRLETFANKASVFPKETYGRLNFNLGAVDFDFLEFEIQGHHMESILAHLLGTEDWKDCRQETWSAPVDALLSRMNVSYQNGQLGEGFFHWTLMESIEKFWSFDETFAKRIAGYLEGESTSWPNIVWLDQLPLANVEIRWANSMGFVTQVLVTGQITASVNGSLHSNRRQPTTIDSHLNPTVSLQVESSIGVELSGTGVGTSSSSSVVLLASLPGRILVKSTSNRIDVQWSMDSSAGGSAEEEWIALHKSHCLDGLCPLEEISREQVEWPKMLERPTDWRKLVSAVSFSWLPDENMRVGWRQFSWRGNSIRPAVFQFSVQLNKSGRPLEWVMTSGSTDLRSTSPPSNESLSLPSGSSQGAAELSPAVTGVVTEGKASQDDPSDFIGTSSDVLEERVKPIGLSAAAAGPSSFPPTQGARATAAGARSWLELPTQIGWALLDVLANAPTHPGEQLEADHLAIEWKWTGGQDIADSTGYRKFIIENNTTAQYYYPGSCRVASNKVNTFDGVEYDPGLIDQCQYMLVAATGTENKLAILLDRGSLNRNQVLKLIMSDDRIEIDLEDKRLVVNGVSIPLPVQHDDIGRSQEGEKSPRIPAGFSLVGPCRRHGPLLYARRSSSDNNNNNTLHVELPIHGLILDIRSEDDILIKAKESLGGQLQGLCGDMNGERLFEFRGPDRCVLSSGSRMAAQYQTSQRSHCPPQQIQQDQRSPAWSSLSSSHERIPFNRRQQTPCARQEGWPTKIKMPLTD